MANVFKQFGQKIQEKAIVSALAKGKLQCMGCGAKRLQRHAQEAAMLHCAACGRVASMDEMMSQMQRSGGVLVGNADEIPAGTQIQRRMQQGGVEWLVPATGNSGGLLFFAVIWLIFIGVFSSFFIPAALAGKVTSGDSGDPASPLLVILFLSLFWAAGFGMAYAAVRSKYSKHQLRVDATDLTLIRELWGRSTVKSIARSAIRDVEQAVFYTRNYDPVYGIQIRGDRQKLRFGSTLSDAERAWLVADLRRELMGPGRGTSAIPSGSAAVAPMLQASGKADASSEGIPSALGAGGHAASAFHDGRIASHRAGSDFRIAVPRSKAALVGAGIGMLMSIIFVVVGWFILRDTMLVKSTHEVARETVYRAGWSIFDAIEAVFQFIHRGFGAIWMITSVLGFCVSTTVFVRQWMRRRRRLVIVGDAQFLRLQQDEDGRVVGEIKYPRSEWRDVRSYRSGTMNENVMMAVELHFGKKVEKIASWMKQDVATDLERDLRQHL